MASENLEKKLVSNVPKLVLAIGGSLLALSLSMNLVGIYIGPAINDWMEFRIEMARAEYACTVKADKKIDNYLKRLDGLQKRFERVEKLAHKKTE